MPFGEIEIELCVLVGETSMPLGRLLRLERGALIPLGRDASAPLALLANGAPVGEGKVEIDGANVRLVVTEGPRA
ncbi:MAG: FliM/FliN family flagellar motor switch protein [Parvularculaceae bacterium]|nr:FliM/FliN family flagellar motor switch protein [Parvularculaceae bacterium]